MPLPRPARHVLATGLILSAVNLMPASFTLSTVAGTGRMGFAGDGGPATAAQLNDPYGIVRGPDGALWFCEHNGHRIRRIAPDGTIGTVGGTGERAFAGDGGPATAAAFNLPHEIRFDSEGNLYVADTGNNAIRRIDARTGIVSTIAGGPGRRGYSGDGGAASEATFKGPHSIQFDAAGHLYICDVGNHAVRRIDARTGLITTIAGTGHPGPTPDGAPLAGTPFNNPRSLDVDRDGNLWLVTREGNQVFKLDLQAGRIRHIAGTGAAGFSGHGGPALAATLSGPKGIALDAAGDAWLADTESHSVRVINAHTGTVELIAGTGEKGDGADGDPRACALNRPHGVFVDADGAIYIGDSEAHKIRVLRPRSPSLPLPQ
jgi:DNA-binding beta-propeller fold protein YncE